MTSQFAGIAPAFRSMLPPDLDVEVRAYDGSRAGHSGAAMAFDIRNQRGLRYILTAPGDLGVTRAYVSGDLVLDGVHPGNPYPLLNAMRNHHRFRAPGAV